MLGIGSRVRLRGHDVFHAGSRGPQAAYRLGVRQRHHMEQVHPVACSAVGVGAAQKGEMHTV